MKAFPFAPGTYPYETEFYAYEQKILSLQNRIFPDTYYINLLVLFEYFSVLKSPY